MQKNFVKIRILGAISVNVTVYYRLLSLIFFARLSSFNSSKIDSWQLDILWFIKLKKLAWFQNWKLFNMNYLICKWIILFLSLKAVIVSPQCFFSVELTIMKSFDKWWIKLSTDLRYIMKAIGYSKPNYMNLLTFYLLIAIKK